MKLAILLLTLTTVALSQSCQLDVVQGPASISSGDGGPATKANLFSTGAIAYDSKGNLYLAQFGAHRIRRIGTDGIITTVAGTGVRGTTGEGGPATQAQINGPDFLAVDSSDRVYFTDGPGRIRRVNTNGTIQTVAGFGVPGFNTDRGPGTSTAIGYVFAMTGAPDGSIYFYDWLTSNARLRRLRPDGILETVMGNAKQPNTPYDFTSTDPLSLSLPLTNADLAVDAQGLVYLSLKRNSSGYLIQLTPADQPKDGRTKSSVFFSIPYGDPALFSGPNRRIYLAYSPRTGAAASTVSTDIAPVNADLSLGNPVNYPNFYPLYSSLATDPTGTVIVRGSAQLYRLANGSISPIAGVAFTPNNVDGGPSVDGYLNVNPYTLASGEYISTETVASDPDGNLLRVDFQGNRLWRVKPGGTMDVIAGTGKIGTDTTTKPAKSVDLNSISAVTVAPDKLTYLSDNGNIRRIRADGNLELVTKLTNFDPNFVTPQRPNVPPGTPIFVEDWAIAADGTIYFRVNLSASYSSLLYPDFYLYWTPGGAINNASNNYSSPQFLAAPDGNVYLFSYSLRYLQKLNRKVNQNATSIPFYWTNAVLTSPRAGLASVYIDPFANDSSALFLPSLDAPAQRISDPRVLPAEGSKVLAATPSGDVYLQKYPNVFLLRKPQDCVKIPTPKLASGGVVNAANFGYKNKISGISLITAFGQNLGPQAGIGGVLDGTLAAPYYLGPTAASDGTIYASSSQVSALFDAMGSPVGSTRSFGVTVNRVTVPYDSDLQVVEATPALFTAGSTGSGQAASLNQDGSANSAANPIARGQIIQLFGTGFGNYSSFDIPDRRGLATPPYPTLALPIKIQVGGKPATVEYAGAAPGLLLGVQQINIRIPADAPTGPNVPLTIQAGSTLAEQSVSIAIK